MSYFCSKCNKKYTSASGLFRHNKTYHLDEYNKKVINNKCQYCNKELSSYGCKWRHEKKCSFNNSDMIEEFKQLKEEVNELKSKINNSKTINSNNTNCNNNQNIICVFPLGKEPDNILSVEYIEKTLKEHGLNSVIEIVKKKHFNPELPQCQNFCVTSRNDTYASVVDPETKKIKYVNKKDVFDKVYMGVVSNVETINNSKKPEIMETVEKIKNIPISQRMLKKLRLGINEEAYHHKDLVKTTWTHAKFEMDIDNKQIIIDKIQCLLDEINNFKL